MKNNLKKVKFTENLSLIKNRSMKKFMLKKDIETRQN